MRQGSAGLPARLGFRFPGLYLQYLQYSPAHSVEGPYPWGLHILQMKPGFQILDKLLFLQILQMFSGNRQNNRASPSVSLPGLAQRRVDLVTPAGPARTSLTGRRFADVSALNQHLERRF